MPHRQPLREHAFRIAMPVVGMVLGLVGVFLVVPVITGRPERGPLWAYLIGIGIGVAVGAAALFVGLRIGRRIVGDRIEAAVRHPDQKWRHGRFAVDPEGLTFERYRWQMRIPSGDVSRLTNVRLGPDTGRRPPLRQLWTINPQLHVVLLDSDQGQCEVATLPSRLEQLREALDGRARD